MRAPGASLLLAAALLGCSRSELDLGPSTDHADADILDSGAVLDADAHDAVPPPPACVATNLGAPLGAPLWKTTVTSDRFLWGPFAADPSGATYFADDGSLLGDYEQEPTLLSLDGCGAVRWRVPWNHAAAQAGGIYMMISGDRLIAEFGDIQAFALSDGSHLWTVDPSALGGPTGVYMGTPVGADTGDVYLPLTTPEGVRLVAIDSTGSASVLATVPNAVANGWTTDLILDATGRLDLSLTQTNDFASPTTPGVVDTFRRDGTLDLTTTVANLDPWNRLIAGPDAFLNEGSASWIGPDGSVTATIGTMEIFSAAMDAQGDLFASVIPPPSSSTRPAIAKFDATGVQVWATSFPDGPINNGPASGPVLGDASNVYFLAQGVDGFAIAALDVETGAQTTWPFEGTTSESLLLTPAGVLVFTAGGQVVGLSSGGARPPANAPWPTGLGGIDARSAAVGQ
jgi:PQQ-like domain